MLDFPVWELQWNDFIVRAELEPEACWSTFVYLSPFLGLPCLCFLLPQAKHLISFYIFFSSFPSYFFINKQPNNSPLQKKKKLTTKNPQPKFLTPQSSTLFCRYFTAKSTGPGYYSFFPFPHLHWGKMTDQLKRTKLIGGLKVTGDNKEPHSPEKSNTVIWISQFQSWA